MNEIELLFTDMLGCDRLALYQNKSLSLGKDKTSFLAAVLKRRISGEPIQYILGKTEFMGFEFKVNSKCLIPRQETEILVEAAISSLSSAARIRRLAILDIGTGSGCIAISLARLLPGSGVDAIDISEEALSVAKHNALLNNVKINFIHTNLFVPSCCPLPAACYDLIIANPPYIRTADIDSLQPEVRYEPHIALDGGEDGLDFYRRLAQEAGKYLKREGLLMMEMGFGQKEEIEKIFKETGNFEIKKVIKDYAKVDRVIIVKNRTLN